MAICTNPFRAASATPVFSSLHKEGKREVDNAPSAINLRTRSEEHTSELQSRQYLVCRLLLEKKPKHNTNSSIRATNASILKPPNCSHVVNFVRSVTGSSKRPPSMWSTSCLNVSLS